MKFALQPTHILKIMILLALALVLGAYVVFDQVEVAKVLNPNHLVEYLQSTGNWAPLIFMAMMALAVVISPIPSVPLDLAAGIAFGPLLGTTYAVIGAEIGALISFMIGRLLGREVVSKLLRTNITFCEKCADHHLAVVVFLARLIPVFSFDLISYGAGLTKISVKAFALATFVGMIPPTFAFTYLGGTLTTVQWPLILSGVVLVGVFLVLPKFILRNRSAWWVQLLQGKVPSEEFQPPVLEPVTERVKNSCQYCGASSKKV
jgi:uncharacterized membrane protein YdjX (TVP38/TMEM64 family)